MAGDKITVTIGGKSDEDFVGGYDFAFEIIEILNGLESVAEYTHNISNQKGEKYKIVSLSLNSPPVVGIEISAPNPEMLISDFITIANEIERDEIREDLPVKVLEKYEKIGSRFGKGIYTLIIANGKSNVNINASLSANAKNRVIELSDIEYRLHDSMKGRIQKADTHDKNTCSLFPFHSVPKIECTFPADLRKKIEESFGKKVLISGIFIYKDKNLPPTKIKIDEVRVLREDDELPTLLDLAGAFPDLEINSNYTEYLQTLDAIA